MLRSQLYSLVDDRTLVDRELDDLRYILAWETIMIKAAALVLVLFAIVADACR